MKLTPMRFAGYTWHHNPKEIKIYCKKTLKEINLPYNETILQDFGRKGVIVKGKGELYGKDCIKQYEKILQLHLKEGVGILSIPNIKPIYANFAKLEIAGASTPNLIKYTFEFYENIWKSKENEQHLDNPKYYTTEFKEDLWSVSHKFNVKIETLIKLNPQIKNPNFLDRERIKLHDNYRYNS